MANAGEARLAPRIGVVAMLVAVVAGVLWWSKRGGDLPATSIAPQAQHGSGAPRAASQVPDEHGTLAITVTDERGPVNGAIVRLAPTKGEIVTLRTGADGIVEAGGLEPGAWRITASAANHLPAALPTTQLAAGAAVMLAIKLSSGGRALTGTVSDASGGPIGGARIDAARLGANGSPGDAISTTVTNADGTYQMTVAEGGLLVAASSADYAPQSRYVTVGPAGAVADFQLVPGGVIEGIVRDARDKAPVPAANVVASRDSGAMALAEPGARTVVSDIDGKFRLTGLRPGAWSLAATAGARASTAETVVGIGVAEQVIDIELLVSRAPVIRGRVIDDTGAAAPRANVEAFARGRTARITADDQGAFVFEGLRPGDYTITTGDQGPATRVSLVDRDVEVVVTMGRAIILKGHVEPRQVCDVQQDARRGPRGLGGLRMMRPPVTTAEDGEFALPDNAPGPVKLTARCPSGDQGSTEITVERGMPEVVVKVSPGASIAGRVVDGAGKPVPGVGVVANNVATGEHTTIRNGVVTSGAQALTDAEGAYSITGLSAGPYRMGALDRGQPLPVRGVAIELELGANEHKTGVDLAVDLPNGVISGVVIGGDGNPLADAWVSVHQDVSAMLEAMGSDRPASPRGPGGPAMRTVSVDASGAGGGGDQGVAPVLTDARGRFEIRGLPRSTFTVIAEAQRGQLRGRVSGVKPDATIQIRALGVTQLSGTVTAAGSPAALFSVQLDGPTRARRDFTDGAFAFGRVDPGRYTVNVQSRDGNGRATVDVVAGVPATVAVSLVANAVVVGKLVNAAGQPVADQQVALTADRGDERLNIMLDGPPPASGSDGSFRLERAAEPCALVVLRAPIFIKRGLALEAGKTLDLGAVNIDEAAPPGPGSGRNPPP